MCLCKQWGRNEAWADMACNEPWKGVWSPLFGALCNVGTCYLWASVFHFQGGGKAPLHTCMWQWLPVTAGRWLSLPQQSAVYRVLGLPFAA